MIGVVETLISKESAALVENRSGKSDVILICEHAGKMLPEYIGSLGVSDEVMGTHIGWDLGAAALTKEISLLLDSPLVLQRYSRLVFDCNRSFDAKDAVVERSDDVLIPGNQNLDTEQRRKRYERVYEPFFATIQAILRDRMAAGRTPIIVTIHSFTPTYKGQERDTELGILHDEDARLADILLSAASKQGDYQAARNEPYSAEDGVTHTLITHGINNQLANVMLEIRNDLIADKNSQKLWAKRIADLISKALKSI